MSNKWSRNCVHGYREADCDVCGQEPTPRELAAPSGSAYRLLNHRDAICPGDERLMDDCQTWETLGEADKHFFGTKYDANFFVPMRRKVERNTESSHAGTEAMK
jgi:hypothetical protein